MNKCGLRLAGNELESIRLILPSSSPCFPLFSLSPRAIFDFRFAKSENQEDPSPLSSLDRPPMASFFIPVMVIPETAFEMCDNPRGLAWPVRDQIQRGFQTLGNENLGKREENVEKERG